MEDCARKIKALTGVGNYLKDFIQGHCSYSKTDLYNHFYKQTLHIIEQAEKSNPWFTRNNILLSLQYWSQVLNENDLHDWLKHYSITAHKPKKIGVIMAGNIPMVGFHDLLCVYLSGHIFEGKLSSDDRVLIPHLIQILHTFDPQSKHEIHFNEQFLKNMDAYIGTGSTNTSRYFEYYFRNKPHIIRRNRNGVAILTGKEEKTDFIKLGQDIFYFFGLGCRNVSKLFVPKGYDFKSFFEGIFSYHEILNHHKYQNNIAYYRTVYLMENHKLWDNNFLILKEDKGFSSPVSVVFYEYYSDYESLETLLQLHQEQLQCVLCKEPMGNNSIPFGTSQTPALNDYPDGINTLEFLINLNQFN